jgi:hypothetical protein
MWAIRPTAILEGALPLARARVRGFAAVGRVSPVFRAALVQTRLRRPPRGAGDSPQRLMDMRQSGTVEAIAGGAEGFALAAKMANSIEHSNALHRTYAPVDEVAVQNVDEARLRSRQKLRVVNKTGRKV